MFLEGFLAAEECLKAIFGLSQGHGKSPCFSQPSLPSFVTLDQTGTTPAIANIGNFLW
jgi:hypothetical protein